MAKEKLIRIELENNAQYNQYRKGSPVLVSKEEAKALMATKRFKIIEDKPADKSTAVDFSKMNKPKLFELAREKGYELDFDKTTVAKLVEFLSPEEE